MNRRKMLKVLPLVAMAGASVRISGAEAKAYELKPTKKYLIIMHEDLSAEDAARARSVLASRGINATIATGGAVQSVYELE